MLKVEKIVFGREGDEYASVHGRLHFHWQEPSSGIPVPDLGFWRTRRPLPKRGSRDGLIAKLAYLHGGHNANEESCGRLALCVDVEDDDAVARYFYKTISSDARRPLEEEIKSLKAKLFDLTWPLRGGV